MIENLLQIHNIKDLSTDSRNITSHTCFFAIKGINSDGNKHIMDALKNGAALVFTEHKPYIESEKMESTKIIIVPDIKESLQIAASIIYKNQPKYMGGVTGTNGKSSIASYFAQICNLLGLKSASLGTIGIESSLENLNLVQNLTTEDFITNKKNLNILANNGVDYVCLEASSHGLVQGRFGDMKFDIGAFSSFSQDHMDYHESIEDYLNSKLILFKDHIVPNGLAVINKDMGCYSKIIDYIKKECNIQVIGVGYQNQDGNDLDCDIISIDSKIDGTLIHFTYKGKSYQTKINIIGSFQVTNILIASIMLENSGLDFDEIVEILPKIKAPKGRLDRIEDSNIFIDYAHSPESLEFTIKELIKLKPTKKSRLITLFGCGGDRDKSKRPIMGSIAANLSDIVIVTDDNPRNEDPRLIRADILSSINGRENITEISGREKAIKKAIEIMDKDDILLIAGKGHEKFQLIKGEKFEFDEFKIVKEYLK
jgi:UDP-N-acetylmuramoyl-L-alanyl-D-glutamate--2,6-diaminopimelate ligase